MMNQSTISIKLDGVEISNRVLFRETSFESQANPMQGTFNLVVRDPDNDFSPSVGQKVTCHIDGVPLFGGYVMRIGRGNFFPAVDTALPVTTRKWTLSGPDFNFIFDKRVIYDPAAPTISPKVPSGKRTITKALKYFLENYIDLPDGLDVSSHVDVIYDDDGTETAYGSEEKGSVYVGASKLWREQMDDFVDHSGAIYYIDGDFALHFHAYENVLSSWTITDANIPGLVNFRDGEHSLDFTRIITEAHVWGGSSTATEYGGTGGDVVYAKYPDPPAGGTREQRAIDALSEYGRWQMGEERIGSNNYLTQQSVNKRAKIIVTGPTGQVPTYGLEGGFSKPLERFTCTWYAHDVPGKAHIVPGHMQDIILYTQNVVTRLPLRMMRISFPTVPTDNPGGETYVEFEGEFGVAYSDSRYLWTFLRKNTIKGSGSLATTLVDNASESVTPGSLATVYPLEEANGTRKTFTFPFTFYLGRFDLYLNGLFQRPSVDYTYEADAKQVRYTTAPGEGDQMWASGYVS